jgi:hypothetical protein
MLKYGTIRKRPPVISNRPIQKDFLEAECPNGALAYSSRIVKDEWLVLTGSGIVAVCSNCPIMCRYAPQPWSTKLQVCNTVSLAQLLCQ